MGSVNEICVAQDRDQWRAVVNAVMNLRLQKMWGLTWIAEELLTSQEGLLHGVNVLSAFLPSFIVSSRRFFRPILLLRNDDSFLSFHISLFQTSFLGALTKLRKGPISFMFVCLSVRPSVHMQQLASHWTDFCEIWYLSIFRKSVEKIQVSLKIWQE